MERGDGEGVWIGWRDGRKRDDNICIFVTEEKKWYSNMVNLKTEGHENHF